MIIAEIPETTSYFWKQSRSATYGNWPFNDSDKCNAEHMAAAGFYVIGGNGFPPDLVECFMCGRRLSDWKSHHDPWSKHMKYQLICPFVRFVRKDENKWTMDELLYLCREYQIKTDKDKVQKNLAKLKDDRERLARNQSLYTMLNASKKRKKPSCYQRSVDQSADILTDIFMDLLIDTE